MEHPSHNVNKRKYNLGSDYLHEWTSFFGFHPQCPVFHQDQCQRCLETQSEKQMRLLKGAQGAVLCSAVHTLLGCK